MSAFAFTRRHRPWAGSVAAERTNLAGFFHLGSIAVSGADIWKYGAAYALICLIIGFSEEFYYRGYMQFTAATGIGFWPAAILLSAYFDFSHIGRATETWLGR